MPNELDTGTSPPVEEPTTTPEGEAPPEPKLVPVEAHGGLDRQARG